MPLLEWQSCSLTFYFLYISSICLILYRERNGKTISYSVEYWLALIESTEQLLYFDLAPRFFEPVPFEAVSILAIQKQSFNAIFCHFILLISWPCLFLPLLLWSLTDKFSSVYLYDEVADMPFNVPLKEHAISLRPNLFDG